MRVDIGIRVAMRAHHKRHRDEHLSRACRRVFGIAPAVLIGERVVAAS
ncbi:MAG TPA: hypothetical protein VMT83_02830 [Burkholderiaceae bacterium]|nr:hypothetical protein [Burkholderiaceae bacterium]